MSKLATATATAPAQADQEEETLKLPVPPRGFHYIAVPLDIRTTAIQSPAIASLCRIGGGDLVAELEEKLPALVAACGNLNRKGSFSLKVQIAPGGMGQMEVSYDMEVKPPKEKKHPSLLFCSDKGQLLNRDPRQQELDLVVVPMTPPKPLRVVESPDKPLRQ